MMTMVRDGQQMEALTLLDGEGLEKYEAVSLALNNLSAFNNEGSDDAYNESNATYRTAIIAQVAVMVVVVVVGIFFSVLIIGCIRIPVGELEDVAIQMAQGNLDVQINYQSKDEIGVLSDQMREVVRKLRAIVEDENQFLAKVAAGDLSVDSICEQEYIGNFHQVLLSFRAIAKRLNEAIARSVTAATRFPTALSRFPAVRRLFPRALQSRQAPSKSWRLLLRRFPIRLKRTRRMQAMRT